MFLDTYKIHLLCLLRAYRVIPFPMHTHPSTVIPISNTIGKKSEFVPIHWQYKCQLIITKYNWDEPTDFSIGWHFKNGRINSILLLIMFLLQASHSVFFIVNKSKKWMKSQTFSNSTQTLPIMKLSTNSWF